jgi:acetyl esterase/lipase
VNEVNITVSIESKFIQPVHQGIATLKALKDAGVPVVGVLWPEGVQHGTLSVTTVAGCPQYTWTPDPLLED